VTLVDDLYEGSKSDTFIIKKGQAEVNFVVGSTTHPWTGPLTPVVETVPPGLTVLLTYNGLLSLPAQPGGYDCIATVVDPSWEGSAQTTYVLGKSPQYITFPPIPNADLDETGGPFTIILNAVAYNDLFEETGSPIEYTIAEGVGNATLDGNLLSITGPGKVVVTAKAYEDEIYQAPDEKVRSFNVTGTIVLNPASVNTIAKLNDDGTVGFTQTGQPFQELSVYSSSDVDGSYAPIIKMMLDENGEAKFNVTAEDSQQFFQVK